MDRVTLRKLKSLLYYVLAWTLCSVLFLFLRHSGNAGENWQILLPQALQFSILSGLSQGFYEILILRDDRFHRPLVEAVIMRSLFQISMLLTNALCVLLLYDFLTDGELLHQGTISTLRELRDHPDSGAFVVFGFLSSFLITFIRTVHKKFGNRVLANTMLGKYQDPVEEERIFMFLDLRSATALAEELGNFAYSAFLRDYFRLVSNCCAENGGEIYQFAGDGVILTWPISTCRKHPRPLRCYWDLKQCFEGTKRRFIREYGHYPQFKAAAHVGRVIATEVGNFGSEMAYHGDALNTTARLQALCNLLKKDFLITESLVRKLPHLGEFILEEHGSFQLKGKNRDLEVFSLQIASNIQEKPPVKSP